MQDIDNSACGKHLRQTRHSLAANTALLCGRRGIWYRKPLFLFCGERGIALRQTLVTAFCGGRGIWCRKLLFLLSGKRGIYFAPTAPFSPPHKGGGVNGLGSGGRRTSGGRRSWECGSWAGIWAAQSSPTRCSWALRRMVTCERGRGFAREAPLLDQPHGFSRASHAPAMIDRLIYGVFS